MIVITGTIKIESESDLVRVKDALIRRAKRSRKDKGNICYYFSTNLEDSTEIFLIEKWESESALNAHLEIPDEEFTELISSTKIEKAIVTSYETTESRELMKRPAI